MNLLVTGSHGLVGRALVESLRSDGHHVAPLVRSEARPGEIRWHPETGELDRAALEAVGTPDALVHLAGENIAGGRWTPERKRRIRESRTHVTRQLTRTLLTLEQRPRVFACASATGYYGDRGQDTVNEDSVPGTGYLASICQEWEAATLPAAEARMRVVNMRLGIVLSREGGALAKMLPAFQLGAGGPLGSGRQWMSWIDREDVVRAIRHTIETESLRGPVNLVGPEPVQNAQFARCLGAVLGRPAFIPVPGFALKLLFGAEMAEALLLTGVRVKPTRLLESGFTFNYPGLEPALRHALGSTQRVPSGG
jgi:uncharacterized protein